MTVYPLYCPTSPCEALVCAIRAHRVAVCREKGCPHRWQREGAEDRARSDEHGPNAMREADEIHKLPTDLGEFELMEAIEQIKEGT